MGQNSFTDSVRALKEQSLTVFEEGLKYYYQKDFKRAEGYFREMLAIYAEDKIAQIYLQRCNHFQQQGVPAEWSGVEVLETK